MSPLLTAHDAAEMLLACVCQALDQAAGEVDGALACPCRACVVPGQPAWDRCDNGCDPTDPGGQLTVHISRIFPTTRFPEEVVEQRGGTNCPPGGLLAVELVVTLLRCAPTIDEQGCPPTCDEMSAAARVVHVDAATILRAIRCCLPEAITGMLPPRAKAQTAPGRVTVLTPQGGCTGVESRVIVGLPQICCPKDSP